MHFISFSSHFFDTVDTFNNEGISWCFIFIIFFLNRLVFLLLFQGNNYVFNISKVLINIRLCFHSFTSDFISYKFIFASRALWNTFLEAVFRAYIPVLVAVSNKFYIFVRYISRKLQNSISLDLFSCSGFYRIMIYLYLK